MKKEKATTAMIKLNWKLHKVFGTDYYYTFHNGKFWCIKADYIKEGIVTDHDFLFQVTTNKMEERTQNKLIQRLSNLFPELSLQLIKNALHYDKNATIQNI